MKEYLARILLLFIDFVMITIAIAIAYFFRNTFGDAIFLRVHTFPLSSYLSLYPFYFVPLSILIYEGIYSYRFDFWHESRLVVKGLALSLILVFAYLALSKSMQDYSRALIVMAFFIMAFLIPIVKNISKKLLYRCGLWQRKAMVYGSDSFIEEEIFGNTYLGYVKADTDQAKTVFVHSQRNSADDLQQRIKKEIANSHEVIFSPLVTDYDLTHSEIYELSNTRTNLIVLKNRLKSSYRLLLKNVSDTLLFLIAFPILVPLLGWIAFKIRQSDPHGPILFRQERMGKDENIFVCYKFRTMMVDGDSVLERYLEENPKEVDNYAKFHKYENDPRITKIGSFLRRTSLDELPQIFNVLKGEMSFIGPRPYMLNEKEKIAEELPIILTVKPGITGLWQVSGRSDVDFFERVELDVWYIQNWNLWMDLVILLKTVKTVLFKQGAS